jgi:exodeoxyribonuclease V gamma subunit
MALYLKVSNSLESLAQVLSQDLQTSGNSVFEPHLIVTQTEGMNNWLKMQIAEHHGIAANCRFLKPNDLIHQLYFLLGGPFTELLSAQNLTWLLFKLLGEKEFIKRFPSVSAYYEKSGSDKDLKRMALAEKAADLFDQYQVYRPEMIREWNNENLQTKEWQEYLWAKAKIASGNSLPDKTVIGHYILDALKDPNKREALKERMKTVHLFGLSIITAYHVQILHEVSSFIDIHFHIINPAPAVYWFEDKSEKQLARWKDKVVNEAAGNPLITGWGRVVQDTFGLFFKYDAFINAYDDQEIVEPEPDSLLHKIQHDVFLSATADRHPITTENISDGSVTINTCYTVAREVEVLYNYLVYLVDKRKESLSPRDIVVMVSDIDSYAPYIKAVFNNAPYKFRYTIADESYADSDNIFNAIHAILQVTEENFKAEEVLQLLDSSYIRNRFQIEDISLIRRVVDAANIRFGMEGDLEDETYLISWKYGLKRIMYGICMSGEEEYGEGAGSFYPIDVLEGSATQEVVRFCHFVEVLMDAVKERKHARTINEWVLYVESVLHNLVYEPQEDIDEDYNALMQQLTDYNLLNEYMSDAVAFDVFGHSFLQTLTGNTRSGLFVNGGITFCSLIPMRSIPFKVVALLGLNYDKFPRKEQPAGFNLMERDRQRGDRNVKENDKHLFLETILSAREYLYISYVGQSVKDNTRMPPSALVDELIDYIASGTTDPEGVKEQLVTLHPLQSFSRKYTGGRLYNYLNNRSAGRKKITNDTKEISSFGFEEIDLEDLVRFFKNPFKAYYNKVLGIYYSDEQILLNETEIFNLDSLQEWGLKNELLPLQEEDMPALKMQLVKTGALPLKNMAEVALRQAEEKAAPVRIMFEEMTRGMAPEIVPVELNIEDSTIRGNIQQVYDGRYVQVSWSKNEAKYLVEAYIRYLAGAAAGVLNGVCLISGAKREAVYEGERLTQREALQRLSILVNIYKEGFKLIAPFSPDFDIKPQIVEELDFGTFTKMVDKKLDGYNAGKNEPYILRAYNDGLFADPTVLESYKFICTHLIVPLVELFPGYHE